VLAEKQRAVEDIAEARAEVSRRPIWLCADDYGISASVNKAIRELVMRGRINATSVMVAAPSLHRAEAASLNMLNAGARRVAIGLHVTLTAPFAPMSPGFRPLRNGAFLPLEKMLVRGTLRRADERVDCAAQFQRRNAPATQAAIAACSSASSARLRSTPPA